MKQDVPPLNVELRAFFVAKGWITPGVPMRTSELGWVHDPPTLTLDSVGKREAAKTISNPAMHRGALPPRDQRPGVE